MIYFWTVHRNQFSAGSVVINLSVNNNETVGLIQLRLFIVVIVSFRGWAIDSLFCFTGIHVSKKYFSYNVQYFMFLYVPLCNTFCGWGIYRRILVDAKIISLKLIATMRKKNIERKELKTNVHSTRFFVRFFLRFCYSTKKCAYFVCIFVSPYFTKNAVIYIDEILFKYFLCERQEQYIKIGLYPFVNKLFSSM